MLLLELLLVDELDELDDDELELLVLVELLVLDDVLLLLE